MKTTSASTYATPFIEHMAVDEQTPFDIVAAMEESFMRPATVPFNRQTTREEIINAIVEPILARERLEKRQRLEFEALGPWPTPIQKKILLTTDSPTKERFHPFMFTDKAIEVAPNRWLQDAEAVAYLKQAAKINTGSDRYQVCEAAFKNEDFATHNQSIDRCKSIDNWIAEQNRPQDPSRYTTCSEVVYDLPPRKSLKLSIRKVTKTTVKDWKIPFELEAKALKQGWVITKRPTTKSHEPAYFSIIAKSGRVIDLAQHEGAHNPILCESPNRAMHCILTRLGGTLDGGEVEILNRLLKESKIEYSDEKDQTSTEWKWLPSYVSQKRDGVWHVRIGWRLNPKVSTGNYHRELTDVQLERYSQLDQLNWFDARYAEPEPTDPFVENVYGELERYNPMAGHTPDQIVTLSQLDYKLLCENSSVTIEDPDGDVVAYMNEDEELVMQGMVRDDDHADEGMDSYLLTQAAAKMDRMIDLNVGSAVWLLPEFEDALLECSRDTRKEMSRAVKAVIAHKAKVTAHVQAYLSHQMTEEENAEMVKIGKDLAKRGRYLKSRTRSILERYRDEREDLASQTRINPEAKPNKLGFLPTPQSSQPDSYHGPNNWTDTAKSTGFDIRFNPQPTHIPGANILPLNTVPTPPARVADMKPACRVTMMQRVKQGTRALIGTKDGYVIKDIPSAKQRPTSARNASPKLTRVLRKMIREDLAYC